MMPQAILFDFDGVLLDSEWAGNTTIARILTEAGHPTTPEQAIDQFMGLAGEEFDRALERWIGGPAPESFRDARREAAIRLLEDGVDEVAGASAFVRGLPTDLPIAVVSSAMTRWSRPHLARLGLLDRFGEHVYSGREHVARMKPAPDLYLFAADRLGVAIDRCLILEDSPVGAAGAVASGGRVIGMLAGSHVRDNLMQRLADAGVTEFASSYEELARLLR